MSLNWTSGAGDPTVMGWFTVGAYLVAATMCARAAMRSGPPVAEARYYFLTDHRFWIAASGLFVLLGINKQLDIQLLFTDFARAVAKAQDWYDERRRFQAAFVVTLGLASSLVLLSSLWFMRRSPGSVKLALAGLACTGTFVVLRAASFHHVDQWLGARFVGIRVNWIAELSAIAVVAAAAARYNRPER